VPSAYLMEIHVFRAIGVTFETVTFDIVTCISDYRQVLDWMIGIIASHIFATQDSAIAILQTFQFTIAHVLGFSVFTSRILVTNL
jgi:hypothetical protein